MKRCIGKFENQESLLLEFPARVFNGSASNFAIPSINWGASSLLNPGVGVT
jgi:hypothetical protein